MAAPCESTRELLISLVNDIELLSKEVFEEATSSQANRLATKGESSRIAPVLEALVKQDEKLHKTLKTAKGQAAVQQRIDAFNVELDKKNGEILSLQKNLKEAETLLASAVYEAKKKLASIKKAEEKAVSADDLIRFAHRISASGAVAAPSTWVPGDPSRRPYPTDTEMRQGYMAKPYDKLRESLINQASQPGSHTPSTSNTSQVETPSTSFPYSWQTQTSLDTPSFMSTSSLSHQMNMKQNNDVEIMSQSDTSSNSSNSNSDDEQ